MPAESGFCMMSAVQERWFVLGSTSFVQIANSLPTSDTPGFLSSIISKLSSFVSLIDLSFSCVTNNFSVVARTCYFPFSRITVSHFASGIMFRRTTDGRFPSQPT